MRSVDPTGSFVSIRPSAKISTLLERRLLLLDGRSEDLLHDAASAPAVRVSRALGVAPAVRPDRVHDAAERCDALVIALLVAVVDALAGKQAVAVVLVRLRVCDAEAGREADAVTRLRQVHVRLEPPARAVVARVVEGDIHHTGDRVGGKPVVETIHSAQRLRDPAPRRPGGSLVIGDADVDVGVQSIRRQVHPGAGDSPAVRTLGAVRTAGRIHQRAAVELGRDADVEGDRLPRDDPWRPPGDAAGQRGRGERQRGEERAHPHGCLRKANNLFTTFSEFKPEPLGAAALIPPGLQTLREWAYAS